MGGLLPRPLTDEERGQLSIWQHAGRTALYVRARILLLAESEPSATAIARVLGLHVQTVREALRRFGTAGLSAVAPRPQPGRPRRFDEEAADVLIALLHDSPAPYGGDEGRWTLQDAATALAQHLDVDTISRETIRRLLKQRRHSWQRAKEWITSPDPQYAFKKSGVIA